MIGMPLAIGGMFVTALTLATGCGGSGGDTMRATLTDDDCTYQGDTTPAPGLLKIEVENKTSHFASFGLWLLAAGASLEDVRQAYKQSQAVFAKGKKPSPRLFAGVFASAYRNAAGSSDTDPKAQRVLRVNASRGRFVIVCFEQSSVDTRTSSSQPLPPAAVYVATELDIGSEH
jgi:hypothetical protein